MKKFCLLFTVSIFVILSCYNDSEEGLFPEIKTCDTSNVTFSGSVKTMLSTYCLSCHGNSVASSKGSGIGLENYQDVNLNSTRMLGAIEHKSGFSPMPKGGPKIDSCSINQFSIWIEKGKLNN